MSDIILPLLALCATLWIYVLAIQARRGRRAARNRVKELERTLRAVEWTNGTLGVFCVACGREKSEGHRHDCPVRAALEPTP